MVEIQVGQIWFNKENKDYIQVKEVTRYDTGKASHIVFSGETHFVESAKTSLSREVCNYHNFVESYGYFSDGE